MKQTTILALVLALIGVTSLALVIRVIGQRETEALEERVIALERRIQAIDARGSVPVRVLGVSAGAPGTEDPPPLNPDGQSVVLEHRHEGAVPAARLEQVEPTVAASDEEIAEAIEQQVDAAVDERVAEIETKRTNKAPSFKVFAEVLELEDYQVDPVQDEIWLGQHESRRILEIPTADGVSLVDELVEVMAYAEAELPEAGPMFMKWMGRVMSEQIPGSNATYGASIDVINKKVYEGLRQELTEEQYQELVGWRLDPNRIEEIDNSPWGDFDERVEKKMEELFGQESLLRQGSEGQAGVRGHGSGEE